ncbi:DUF3108 domain-containing protein [uncultured Sunxiuqinia sp.]|uniref:DUF3108 domain-containing protein n=1 Tax=uncultured Sunxiuqinia sp. TaxID=1573825 RepID=UPI0030D7B3E8
MLRIKGIIPNHNGRVPAVFSLLFLLVVFLYPSDTIAQKGANQAFLPGEKLTYGAYYNWHFIWVNSGEVVFTADTTRHASQTKWNFRAIGRSFKAYDLFYSVRDTFVSRVIYEGLKPDYFIRRVNHAKSSTIHEYTFDDAQHKIYSYVKREKGDPFRDTLMWKDNTADMLSTVYQFRAYDFDRLKKRERVNFRMLVDNKTEDLYFRYLGQEEVKTRNGREFRCHHVLITLLGGDFFPDGEYMNVWFTADQNRIPVKVETKILVGSVSAILTDLEHIKYPLTSEIN